MPKIPKINNISINTIIESTIDSSSINQKGI